MELVKATHKIRCEMGACKNFADYTIRMSRVGIKSRLHVCECCLHELGSLIKAENNVPKSEPKSIETYSKKAKKDK